MSVPAYPEYKDSGVAWLGAVPSHWEVSPVKAIATFNDEVLTEATEPDLEIQYIEISDVQETSGIKAAAAMMFGDAPSRARRVVRTGDILVSTVRTYLRAIAPVPSELDGAVASTGFCVIRGSLANSRFLGFALRSEAFVAEVIARSVGVSYPAINASDLVAIKVPLPSYQEQTAIAAFLDRETAKIDWLVAEQERLIALLKEKRQTVISHAVTKGLNPLAQMKDSGIEWLGEIPAHWEAVPLKHLASFRSGGTPSKENIEFWNGEIPWASAKDLKVEQLYDTIDHLTEKAILEGAASLIPVGAVVVLVRGMMLARLFPVCELGAPMAINQDLKALLPSDRIGAAYLAWVLRGTADETLNRLDEAGHGTKALRMEAWTSMPLPLPPFDEQSEIVGYIRATTQKIDQLSDEAQSAINLMQERRAALISAAVTGKIDVRGALASSNVVSIDTARTVAVQPSLRGCVGAMSIRALGSMGRMAVMKGGYLAEGYAGVSELGGTYQRDAAGPFCRAVIDGMERDAAQAFGINVIEPDKDGAMVTYRVPPDFGSPASFLPKLLGEDRAKRLALLFDLLKELNRDAVEAIATVFAVWNDLLASGQSVDEDAIIRGVLTEWHPEKAKKFNRDTLAHWLAWMHRNQIVPDGTAPRTDHQGSLFQ